MFRASLRVGEVREDTMAPGEMLELRAAGDRGGELQALYETAVAERRLGQLDSARKRIFAALDLQELTRRELIRDDWRSSYGATQRRISELAIEILMDLHRSEPDGGYAVEALSVSERARARSFLELLESAGVDLDRAAPAGLLELRRTAERALTAQAERQLRLVMGPHTAVQVAAADEEAARLVGELREIVGQIRSSAELGSLRSPTILAGSEIGPRLLDGDTTLIELALGEERSHAWVVDRTSVRSFELPKRETLERLARRVHAQLTPAGDPSGALAALGQAVLGPLQGALHGRRLVVVPDGALHSIPFEALTLSGGAPVVARWTVVMLPSASALAAVRRQTEARPPAPKVAAVLADPVYDTRDPRVWGVRVAMASRDERVRAVRDTGLVSLERLSGTRREAAVLHELAPADGLLEAVGFDASRRTVLDGRLGDYRILHFATHGLLDERRPELSGLVLSLIDSEGHPQDGFLQAHEISGLGLRADLVVLSACKTALGQEIRGEGLVGLSWAFMSAGVPRVVASLWSVPDRATAELMKRFYRGILAEERTPAEALQRAQTSLRKERRWSSPYFWGGFVLQGDWR